MRRLQHIPGTDERYVQEVLTANSEHSVSELRCLKSSSEGV